MDSKTMIKQWVKKYLLDTTSEIQSGIQGLKILAESEEMIRAKISIYFEDGWFTGGTFTFKKHLEGIEAISNPFDDTNGIETDCIETIRLYMDRKQDNLT